MQSCNNYALFSFIYLHIVQTMIINPPEDQAVLLGENITFTCIASGINPPSIVWGQIFDGNTIPISDGIKMSVTGNTVNSTLTISDVLEDDFGDYQCMAGDRFSVDVVNFTVHEAGKHIKSSYCIRYPSNKSTKPRDWWWY